MWAYVDETGNTLNNFFDEEQPLFITAAFMTKTNFDLVAKQIEAELDKIMDADMPEEQLGEGRKLSAEMEAHREDLVAAHGLEKAGRLPKGVAI